MFDSVHEKEQDVSDFDVLVSGYEGGYAKGLSPSDLY